MNKRAFEFLNYAGNETILKLPGYNNNPVIKIVLHLWI